MKEAIVAMKRRLEVDLDIEISDLEKISQPISNPSMESLASMIDHTLLNPEAGKDQHMLIFEEARRYHFHSVCIPPHWVELAAKELKETPVNICTVIGFPLGYATTDVKVFEAKDCIRRGADEIDMVMNISAFKSGDYSYVWNEIKALREAVGREIVLKVIIETAFLGEVEKYAAGWMVKAAGADFVKTSTGFASEGAKVEDVRLLKSIAGRGLGVKASGGIRDQIKALEMIRAGATRLGASKSVAIVQVKKKVPSSHSY